MAPVQKNRLAMVPRILLADADAFFVAVARLVDPSGAGRAPLLLVGGSPQERGVVCSASYEARRFGVRSAMPMATAVRLCPQAMVVPVPRRACVDKSRAIRQVLDRFAPVVEAASIDEWYLELSGTEVLYGHEPLVDTARRIRLAVHAETGLWVSIGGGTNKLVAKLAVELAKKPAGAGERGAHVVAPGAEGAFMTRFQLGEIPLVGPRLQERLQAYGLRSVTDALPYDEAALRGMLGERLGRWLFARVRGVCPDPVVAHRECKSIGREETFALDVHDEAALAVRLRGLIGQAAGELRRAGFCARTLTVKMKDADFTARQRSRTLAVPAQSERALSAVGLALLAELWAARPVGARLLGVSLSGLGALPDATADAAAPGARGEQLRLFAEPGAEAPRGESANAAGPPAATSTAPSEVERDRQVARLFDAVRAKFGEGALVPGWDAADGGGAAELKGAAGRPGAT